MLLGFLSENSMDAQLTSAQKEELKMLKKYTNLSQISALLIFLLLATVFTVGLQKAWAEEVTFSEKVTDTLAKEAKEKKHVVLQIDGETVYVDYGRQDGVEAGMEVTILSYVSFQHPATGEKIEGIIPISTGTIAYVTETFSAIKCESESLSRVQVGDEVVLSVLYQLEQRKGRLFTPAEERVTPQKKIAAPSPASPEQAVLHQPVPAVEMGQQIHISAFVTPPYSLPTVKYRRRGELDYISIAMVDKGNGFFGVTLPTREARPPGIEYYLTVKDTNGEEALAFSNPAKPQFISVSKIVKFYLDKEEERALYGGRKSKFHFFQEYVRFSTKEHYYRMDMDYLYRVFSNLYSIRMGMGGLRGKGAVYRGAKPEFSAFYYGYSEVELRALPYLSFINKILLGIHNEGVGAGYEGGLRIGRELGVNLLLGLLAAQRVGTQGLIKLNVPVTDRFTTGGTVSVENFPVSRETGFRMFLDLSYSIWKIYVVGLRAGFAARDIHRTGPNIGGGLFFNF